MAAPAYASDLIDIIADMPNTTNWTALGGGAAGMTAPETDYFIQGSNCISKAGWGTATKGMIYNFGSGITVTSGEAVWFWIYYWAPNSMDTEAGGGMQALIGSTAAAYKQWYVRGSDTLTYGGWVCVPIDPTVAADATTGAPGATLQYFGSQIDVPGGGPSKGNPLGIDAMRYGRDFSATGGDVTNGYANFTGSAGYNDAVSRRYGQFQAIDGGYLWQGRFLLGSGSTAVDFRDSNRNIVVARTTKVGSSFNTFEVQVASSNISWTNINISALGTVSRGNFLVTDDATVAKNTCVFTDMGTFTYKSNSTLTNCTYRRCNLVTQVSASFVGCTFDDTNDADKAILSDKLNLISDCAFTQGGSDLGHGIELQPGAAGTYSFSGNTFSGYGATVFGFHTTNDVTSATDVVTEVAHGFVTGEAVRYMKQGGTAAIGLTDNTTYYVRAVSSDTVAFYASKANAEADTSRIDLTAAGTDTHYVNSMRAAIYNNTGGAVTINLTGGGDTPTIRNGTSATTTVNSSVPVTITVVDTSDNPIQNAQVALYVGATEVANADTNASGIVSTSYAGAVPASAFYRVRKSSTGASKYIAVSGPATIQSSTGLSVKVVLRIDTNAN